MTQGMRWREGASPMLRLLTRHRHNPGFTLDDQATLNALEGLERARLRDGKWVSRAGQIWSGFDRAVHMIDEADLPEVDWYFGSFDQGTRHPGCFQVWGVCDGALYRVQEIYFTGKDIDWWAERVVEADEEYGLHLIFCDHDPDYVKKFNDFLALRRGEDSTATARNADKALLTGIKMVEWALSKAPEFDYPENDAEGPPTQTFTGPRLFFVRDAFPQGLDQKRLDAKRPACTEKEIPNYTWILKEDGQPQPEKPNPTCADHGCDATRYAVMGYWKKDYKEPDKGWEPTPLSYADWAGVGVHEDDAL